MFIRLQNGAIASRNDEDAFIYGLKQFPALQRVIITPTAHGWLFAPLYETPFIRNLPYGLNHPIPRGWPVENPSENPQDPLPWEPQRDRCAEGYKEQWHGVRIALRVLAQHEHDVAELNFDINSLFTGVNSRIFDQPCEEYNHLVAIMKRPGHLDLPLLVGVSGTYTWTKPRMANLHRRSPKRKM
jgi:hypothetical protein